MSRSTWSNTTEKVLQHHKLQLEIATLLAAQRKRDETMSFEHNPVFLQLAHLEIDLPQLPNYKDVYLKTKKVMQKRSAEADSSDCILCPKQSRSSLLAQPDEIAFECEDGHCPLSLVFTLNQRKKVYDYDIHSSIAFKLRHGKTGEIEAQEAFSLLQDPYKESMNLTGGHSKAESEPELDLGHFPGFNSDEDDEYVPPQPAAGLRQPRGVKRHFPKREPFSDDMIDPQLKRVKLECDMKPEPAQKAKSAATAGEMKAREVSTILQDSYKEPINLTSDFSKTEFELSLNLAHCPDVALDEDNGAESPRPSMGPSQPREVRRQVPPKREPFPDDMIDPEFKRVKRACDMQPEPVPKEESARAAPASSTNNHTFSSGGTPQGLRISLKLFARHKGILSANGFCQLAFKKLAAVGVDTSSQLVHANQSVWDRLREATQVSKGVVSTEALEEFVDFLQNKP